MGGIKRGWLQRSIDEACALGVASARVARIVDRRPSVSNQFLPPGLLVYAARRDTAAPFSNNTTDPLARDFNLVSPG